MAHTEAAPVGADPPEATPDGPIRRRWTRVDVVIPVLLSLAFSLFAWRHIVAHPLARTQSTGGEEGLFLWFLAHAPWSVLHGHNPFVSDAINYPAGVNLLWNTSLLTPALVFAPVTELGGAVLAYNLTLVVALATSVLACYAAIRRFVTWWPAALVGAAFVACSPYLDSQARGHVHLILMGIPPLFLLVGDELLVRQRMRPGRLGLLLAFLVVLQVGCSTEIVASSAVVAGIGVGILAVLHRSSVTRERLRYVRRCLTVTAAAGAVVLALPAYYLLFGAQHLSGPAQSTDRFRADLLSPVFPTSVQRIAPGSLVSEASHFSGNGFENTGYLGVTLILLVIGTALVLRRDAVVRWAAPTALASLVLSLGTTLRVDGRDTGFPLPYKLLTLIPLFSSGTAVRYSYYTMLLCALVVALGCDRAYRASSVRRPVTSGPGAWWLPGAAFPAAAALAFAPLVPAVLPFHASSAAVPPFFTGTGVKAIPVGSVVLTYPFTNRFQSTPMTWQALAGFRYNQIGSYAITPDKHGNGVFDVQTATAFVETRLEIGTVLGLGTAPVRSMRQELARWKVGSVLVVLDYPHAPEAVDFYTRLLGRTPVVIGGVADFVTGAG